MNYFYLNISIVFLVTALIVLYAQRKQREREEKASEHADNLLKASKARTAAREAAKTEERAFYDKLRSSVELTYQDIIWYDALRNKLYIELGNSIPRGTWITSSGEFSVGAFPMKHKYLKIGVL